MIKIIAESLQEVVVDIFLQFGVIYNFEEWISSFIFPSKDSL